MKNLLKLSLLALMVMSLFVTSCKKDDDVITTKVDFGVAPTLTITNGEVQVITTDKVRYHTLSAFSITSAIVETENSLVIMDVGVKADYLPDFGTELKAYADAIGKTISAVIITHDHADHWGNIDLFASSQIYAETTIADELSANGDFTTLFSGTINKITGSETFDGLTYQVETLSNVEAHKNSYFYIEEEKIFFAEDLVGYKWQLFLREYTPLTGEDEIDNWIVILDNFKTKFGDYDHMFVGHGFSTSEITATLDENITYLTDAQGLIKGTKTLTAGGYATTNKEVIDELKLLYPTWGTGSIDLALPEAFYHGDPGAIWFE